MIHIDSISFADASGLEVWNGRNAFRIRSDSNISFEEDHSIVWAVGPIFRWRIPKLVLRNVDGQVFSQLLRVSSFSIFLKYFVFFVDFRLSTSYLNVKMEQWDKNRNICNESQEQTSSSSSSLNRVGSGIVILPATNSLDGMLTTESW